MSNPKNDYVLFETPIDIRRYVLLLWRRKFYILLSAVVGLVLGLIFSARIPSQYSSSALWLPSGAGESGGGSLLAGLLGGDARSEGLSVEKYYRHILAAPDFYEGVDTLRVDTLSIAQILLGKELPDDTVPAYLRLAPHIINNNVQFEERPIFKLTTRTTDPILSKKLIDFILEKLQWYNENKRAFKGQKNLEFALNTLREVEVSVKEAEDRLSAFHKQNTIVTDPYLRAQMERLKREVDIHTVMLLEFRKQAEMARLNLEKQMEYIELIQWPRVSNSPERGEAVKRAAMLTILPIMLSLFLIVLMEVRSQLKD
jgi:hypothetical protein